MTENTRMRVVIYGEQIPFSEGRRHEENVVDVKRTAEYLILVKQNSRKLISHELIDAYTERME